MLKPEEVEQRLDPKIDFGYLQLKLLIGLIHLYN